MSTIFSEALRPLSKRLSRPVRDIEILRVATLLGGDDFASSIARARKAALTWAKKRTGSDLPDEAWSRQDFDLLAGGRNIAAVRFLTENVDLWALRAEDPDKNVAGRIWTTEIVIGGENQKRPHLSLRLIVSTSEPEFSIEPHVPGTVLQMLDAPGLIRGGRALSDTPLELQTEYDADDLCDYLEDPQRRLPVFIISLSEDSEARPLVDDAMVAKATAGIARVFRLPAHLTWVLTKRFGKQRSVFDGAVRAYLPGFSSSDDPYRHRLFLAGPLREATYSKSCEIWLRRFAADLSVSSTRLGKDVVDFATVRTASRRLRASNLAAQKAPDAELLVIAQELNEDLERRLSQKDNEIEYYLTEAQSAEDRAKSAEQENRSLLFKVRELRDALARGTTNSEQSLPTQWSEFTDWLDQNFPDRIVLTPAARRMVRNPEFEDVTLVARAVAWLATDHYSRRTNGGGSTRDEVIEAGIINAFCGGDTYHTYWQGRRYDVDQHIKNGNTRDPKRCLRIYYFWEPELQQTVIDHLPAHRHTGAT